MRKIYFTIFFIFLTDGNTQTRQQIDQAKQIIKNTGMSESEVRSEAKKQGYTQEQIERVIDQEKRKSLKNNEEKVGNNVTDKIDKSSLRPIDELSVNPVELIKESENLEIINEEEKVELEKKTQPIVKAVDFFGYDIFQGDPSRFQQASVGAVDPDYLIGPGDEIIVMLWGETQFRQVLAVNREGFIFIPEIGQVFVNGLSLNLLESKLFRVLSQSYASLNPAGRKATTFLDISLGNLRPLRIQVLGEVSQPGAYVVSPSTTLFSSLYYFSGPTTLGSLRDIRLIRNSKEISSIDFYDFLLTGKKLSDEKLQLDDVIFIPKRMRTISIYGEINRPGIYELKPNETLKDMISIAGELKVTAYLERAQIDRIVPFSERKKIGMDRMFSDIILHEVVDGEKDFDLVDGDKIQIFSILDLRQNTVSLTGAVSRPGIYDIGDSLRLKSLISKADSLLGDAYTERVDVIRIRSDFSEELIKLNLNKALNEDPVNNILLRGMDQVNVYSLSEMIPNYYVSISGHVKKPGKYLLQENMTLFDIIFKAGGYLDEEFKKLTYLERAELVRTSEKNQKKK